MPDPLDDDRLLNAMLAELGSPRERQQARAVIAVQIARLLYPEDESNVEERATGLMSVETSELELMLNALEERIPGPAYPLRSSGPGLSAENMANQAGASPVSSTSFGDIPRGTWDLDEDSLSQLPGESDEAYQARLSEILRPPPRVQEHQARHPEILLLDPRGEELNWAISPSSFTIKKEKEKPPGPSLWARLLDLKNWI